MTTNDLIKQAEEFLRYLEDRLPQDAELVRQLIAKVKEREGWVLVPEDLIRFLHGEEAFHGVHFGDKPLEERGNFWWRKYLPRAKP